MDQRIATQRVDEIVRVRRAPEPSFHVPSNGDVLVAESTSVPRSLFWLRYASTMRRASATVSPNRITLLRGADGDDVAQIRGMFLEHLNQPFGMAALGDTFCEVFNA